MPEGHSYALDILIVAIFCQGTLGKMLDLLQQWSQTLDIGKGLAEFFLVRTA